MADKRYRVTRIFEHPPREGDAADVLDLQAPNGARAIELAMQQLDGKQGTYSATHAPSLRGK